MRFAFVFLLVAATASAAEPLSDAQRHEFADEMLRCSAMNNSFALASGDGGFVAGSRHYSERYLAAANAAAGQKYVSDAAQTIQAKVQKDFIALLSGDKSFDLMTAWQESLIQCNAEADKGETSLSSNKSFKPTPLRGSA